MRTLSYTWKERKDLIIQRLMVGRSIAGERPTHAKSWRLVGLSVLEPESVNTIWSTVR